MVILLSDGWDRGEPEELAEEMARLARTAHRIVWLNPLAADPRYEPLTRGMRPRCRTWTGCCRATRSPRWRRWPS